MAVCLKAKMMISIRHPKMFKYVCDELLVSIFICCVLYFMFHDEMLQNPVHSSSKKSLSNEFEFSGYLTVKTGKESMFGKDPWKRQYVAIKRYGKLSMFIL